MSALTGIAIREKLIQNESQKVSDLLPEYFAKVDDARKENITVRDVLTMTGGLDLIAVVTADVRKSSIDGRDNQNIVSDYVLPAVK